MLYRQDIVTRMPIMRVELISISTVPYEVFGTTLADFFVLENFRCKFANLVVPPTDVTTKCLVRCNIPLVL